jgi:hypothetical protein
MKRQAIGWSWRVGLCNSINFKDALFCNWLLLKWKLKSAFQVPSTLRPFLVWPKRLIKLILDWISGRFITAHAFSSAELFVHWPQSLSSSNFNNNSPMWKLLVRISLEDLNVKIYLWTFFWREFTCELNCHSSTFVLNSQPSLFGCHKEEDMNSTYKRMFLGWVRWLRARFWILIYSF